MAKKTRNFAEVIRRKLARDPVLTKAVKEERLNADIAIQIYEARKEAGLTQTQLAKMIGSQQSVIARLEDADYDGHSLTMLSRIAEALQKRLRVSFEKQPVS
jgi:ribosome-binding protein aMBF1 (putative translation factor)